ncbi:MAG: hypothetical protein ABSC95_29875 [Acetobacteraceae bacterium]|jgi:hypothetical protein
MLGPRRLSPKEIAEVRCRRPAVRASLACEGLRLTAGEEALFEQFDQQHLTMQGREARLIAWSRARRAAARAHAAE